MMRVLRGLGAAAGTTPRGRSVALGVFDGVHLAHRRILRKAVATARRLGARATVLTFDPHPKNVLFPDKRRPILQSLEHRLRIFSELGFDEAIVIRFDRRFAATTAEGFLRLLTERLDARAVCVGHDFRFGRHGQGDAALLRSWAAETGRRIWIEPPYKVGGEVVSSTLIRGLVLRGELGRASRLLGRRVSVYGNVVRGHGRGRKIGFATANLNPHHETLPPAGVYAAWGAVRGRRIAAVVHIGPRPTFAEKDPSIEVHFLSPQPRLYGSSIEVGFVRKLRDINRFNSTAELIQAIRSDVRRARVLLRTRG